MKFTMLVSCLIAVLSGSHERPSTATLDGPRHEKYRNVLDRSLLEGKPVLLHFTADHCPNPIRMQEYFASDALIRRLVHDSYIYLELSVSDKTALPKSEVYAMDTGAEVKTVGMRNADLEITIYHSNVQPYLVITNGLEEIISSTGFVKSADELRRFLMRGTE